MSRFRFDVELEPGKIEAFEISNIFGVGNGAHYDLHLSKRYFGRIWYIPQYNEWRAQWHPGVELYTEDIYYLIELVSGSRPDGFRFIPW